MSDGLNEYRHDPLLWCAVAVREQNEFDIYDDEQCRPENVKRLVERTMEFITLCFEDEDLPVPSSAQVLQHTLKRLKIWRT